MADLTGTTPADTYKGLLQVNDYTDGVNATAKYIQDGEGTDSALAISTDKVGIGTTSPLSKLHVRTGDEFNLTIDGSTVHESARFTATTAGRSIGIMSAAATLSNYIGSLDTNHQLRFFTTKQSDGSRNTHMAITEGGNVGIGTTSPDYTLDVNGAVHLGNLTSSTLTHIIRSGGGVTGNVENGLKFIPGSAPSTDQYISFYTGTATPVHIGSIGSASDEILIKTRDSGTVLVFKQDGNVTPGTDDAQDFGAAAKRWDDIYATNTTIQTSDRELKQDIEELSEAETRVAQACKGLLRKYRWKSSVAEKGDDARIHFGIMAQDLEAAFAAEGLDAGRYGMFIKNTWWEADRVVPAVEAVEAIEAVYDEEGNEVSPAVEAVEAQPERTELDIFNNIEDAPEGATEVTQRGVRYAELLAFIIAAI